LITLNGAIGGSGGIGVINNSTRGIGYINNGEIQGTHFQEPLGGGVFSPFSGASWGYNGSTLTAVRNHFKYNNTFYGVGGEGSWSPSNGTNGLSGCCIIEW